MRRFILPDWFCDWEEEGGTKIETEQLLRGEFLPEDFHLTEEQFDWDFKTMPTEKLKPKRLNPGGWTSLKECCE